MRTSRPDLLRSVRTTLAAAGDPERARAQQAYLKSTMPHRGLTAPELRRLLRPLLTDERLAPTDRADWERAVRTLWDDAEYREERYAAIELTGHRAARGWQDPAALPLYGHLVTSGAWWDLVDPVADPRVGAILAAHRAETTPVITRWARAEDLWLRRTAIICQLRHREDTDLALLTEVIDANLEGSTHGREFFVRKAIGWALRQYARTDPRWVTTFVAERGGDLSGLTRREALKHLPTP